MSLRAALAGVLTTTCDQVWGDVARYVFMSPGAQTRKGGLDPAYPAFDCRVHHVADTRDIVSDQDDALGSFDAFWRENSIVYRFDRRLFEGPGRRAPSKEDRIERGGEIFVVSDVFDNDFTRIFCAVTKV